MVSRLLKISKSSSFFMFGNRGVGKSTHLEHLYPKERHLWIDLLDPGLYKKLSIRPELLKSILNDAKEKKPKGSLVIIDEVQKIPELLDIVHSEIEQGHFKFALTGSSARKLKKQGVNLLAGRAFVYHLYPFTHVELDKNFVLDDVLAWGSLPKVFTLTETEDKQDFLSAYTDTYLREEIIAEQLVRQVVPFRHFLEVAAQSNSKIINYSNIANDIDVDITTVQNYFQILEDTFIGMFLPPFHESIRKRQRRNPKFYFFDCGVTRALQNKLTLGLTDQTYEYGDLFEQFIILEFHRLNSYYKKSWKFSYLRTKDGVEVDLVVERPGLPRLFIEIKSTNDVSRHSSESINGFKRLVHDSKKTVGVVLSRDPLSFTDDDGIKFVNWKAFFSEAFQ